MLTSEKPIASEQLTFTVPSDPNAAYDPSAINPTLVAEGTSATGSPISIDSEHITVTYADGTAPSADYSETFFNVLPDDSYGALTFSACTDKGNAASFTITRSTPVVANWVYTVDQTASFTKAAAPTVEWLGHEDLTTPVELAESGNSADIRVSAPGGIKSMQVDIASAPLATLLPLVNLAESMDLTSPATEEMASMLAQLGFPTPAQLLNQQHVYFQIGGLIDMLAMVCAEMTETTNSDFKFTVTDNAGQETVITLKYVKTVVSPITYNNDADLWANTASFTLNIPADATSVSVQYKKSTASDTEWQTAEITGNNTKAEIKPDWGTQFTAADWTTPNSVQPFWRITEGTGVFANNTYDYKLTVDGTEYKGQFTTKTDQIIPEGNMENTALPCFILQDASKTSETWGSGNNKVLSACWLCQQADGNSGKCAYLTSGTQNTYVFGKLLTAGNLFFGQFTQNGTGGDVRFGQIYPWKSRPSAMRVSYKAEVDNVDYVNTTTTVNIPKNSPDKARIFVAVVDWTGPHTVTSTLEVKSGLPATVIGSWDPETTTDPGEGKIIGYGSLWIEKGKTDWQTIDIPINYYDKTAKPTDGKYSLVISCACNAYGEFFNGCSTNKLWVDDFEWVY